MPALAKSVHVHTLLASRAFTVIAAFFLFFFTFTVHPEFRTVLPICNGREPTMFRRCISATENKNCTFFILSVRKSYHEFYVQC